jgi:hypothetical protein
VHFHHLFVFHTIHNGRSSLTPTEFIENEHNVKLTTKKFDKFVAKHPAPVSEDNLKIPQWKITGTILQSHVMP